MTAKKLLGLIIVFAGVATGALCTGIAGLLFAGYWHEIGEPIQHRGVLILFALLGALTGFGIYHLGQRIAR